MTVDFERREENRLRAAITRAGYMLRKCRSRNPDNSGYGLFCILDPSTNFIVHGGGGAFGSYTLELDDVADWLKNCILGEGRQALTFAALGSGCFPTIQHADQLRPAKHHPPRSAGHCHLTLTFPV